MVLLSYFQIKRLILLMISGLAKKNGQKIVFFLQSFTHNIKNDISLRHYLSLVKLTMQKGKIKFFNETKGFGFITPDAGGEDVFVHSTGLIDKVRENDTVTYEVQQGKKGLNAVNVKLA
jgi:CspA family cold shock protein